MGYERIFNKALNCGCVYYYIEHDTFYNSYQEIEIVKCSNCIKDDEIRKKIIEYKNNLFLEENGLTVEEDLKRKNEIKNKIVKERIERIEYENRNNYLNIEKNKIDLFFNQILEYERISIKYLKDMIFNKYHGYKIYSKDYYLFKKFLKIEKINNKYYCCKNSVNKYIELNLTCYKDEIIDLKDIYLIENNDILLI